MCTYSYFHHHHMYPCNRDIEYVIQYIYCPAATFDQSTQSQLACLNTSYHDHHHSNDGTHVPVLDLANPCANGGCLASPDCHLGKCRLADLNGLWVCCRCGLGGNRFTSCHHPMKKSPDALCYHRCCETCLPDAGAGTTTASSAAAAAAAAAASTS